MSDIDRSMYPFVSKNKKKLTKRTGSFRRLRKGFWKTLLFLIDLPSICFAVCIEKGILREPPRHYSGLIHEIRPTIKGILPMIALMSVAYLMVRLITT